jgi:broad specificity phosphatase PhoE
MITELHNQYYLMRHGESLANQRGIIVSHACNAKDKFGLTPHGSQQVMQAALASQLDQATVIISSDYKRARETAEMVAITLNVDLKIEYNLLLRERDFGDWELQSDQYYDKVWQQDAKDSLLARDGVETVQNVATRTADLLQSLEDRFQDHTILLVGHGDVLQILSTVQQSIDPRFHRSLVAMGNAEIRML